MRLITTLASAILLSASAAAAQTPAPAPAASQAAPAAPAPTPTANPADVESIDAILAALYDVISGPAGQARDWDRFRSLFLPGASMGVVSTTPDGQKRARLFTPEGYITTSGPFLERDGFFEVELGRRVDNWGPLIRVMSGYDGKRTPDADQSLVRGVNLIQLVDDGKRLWIASIVWTVESDDYPIPEDLRGPR